MRKPSRGRIVLGNAAVSVEAEGVISRFRIDAAWIEVLPAGKRPVRLRLEGDRVSLTLEMPLTRAWLLAEIHERTVGFREKPKAAQSARNAKKNPEG